MLNPMLDIETLVTTLGNANADAVKCRELTKNAIVRTTAEGREPSTALIEAVNRHAATAHITQMLFACTKLEVDPTDILRGLGFEITASPFDAPTGTSGIDAELAELLSDQGDGTASNKED